MESTLGATGSLGSLGKLSTPVRKTRSRKARAVTGEISVTSERSSTKVVEDTNAACGYTRAASAEALSDVALVEMTLAGKQEAFAILVERYKDAVQNLAYRMLSNVTEAEDVTQEVFV